MAYTKRDIVKMAFEEIGLASYVFDLSAEQLQSALSRLDGMMAIWSKKGIRTSYPIPSGLAFSSLDQSSNLTADQVEAVVANLAVRIAPAYGKTVSPDTRSIAKSSYNEILRTFTVIPEQQLNNMMIPAGSGSKPWRGNRSPFLPSPSDVTPALDVADFNFDYGSLFAGDTYSGVSFTLREANNTPIDLTNAEIFSTFRYGSVDGPVALSFSVGFGISVVDAPNGEFRIDQFEVPAQVGLYYSDVEVLFSDGSRKTYIKAIMRVQQQVTRNV